MLPNLTPAATRAVESASRCAHHRRAGEVGPLHLLQGLLEEEEGHAMQLLLRGGIDVSLLRAIIPVAPPNDDSTQPNTIPHSGALNAIVRLARELAADYSLDGALATDVLLLALLRHDESIRQALEHRGFKMSRLEQAFSTEQGPTLTLEQPLEFTEHSETIEAGRILDASANRAREAFRVIEDYCRFVLDDAFLSGELKHMRHDLSAALEILPADLLVEARDTLQDVGTAISTRREQERESLMAVVQANLKRLQEALRSLEEYGKTFSATVVLGEKRLSLGQVFEQLRYRSYTLERAILLGTSARHRLADARLMVLLSGSSCQASLEWTIREAAAGGASIIQLREKSLDDRQLLERARDVRKWTHQVGVLFILNDRPDIARLAGADGVHLGQEDMSVKDARRIVGPEMLIGVSTHNLEQLRQAILDGASYVGVGPTFASGTKEFPELAGLEFVRRAMAETSLPAFIIGGINRETISAAVAAGARRVAVSQAIAGADDPRSVARELVEALKAN